MARSSFYSPSPSLSPRPSPHFSDSSLDELTGFDASFDPDPSVSRPISPPVPDATGAELELESVRCLWEDCGKPFSHLPTLIDHIHSDHIGVNKSTYTCEWATCPRRGLQQASRFALISHIRAHTGEKPFTCPLPECDKSFTRSDAMAKHMRLQHNISPPLPGRGGNRKRKREEAEPEPTAHGFTTFKVDATTPTEGLPGGWDGDDASPQADERERADYFTRRSASPAAVSVSSAEERERGDGLPLHLMQAMDPQTGKIFGRSPMMVRYLTLKAKHRYVLEQHEQLLEELRVARNEERAIREAKEEALDQVLRTTLGPQAEFLIAPPDLVLAARQGIVTLDSSVSNGPDLRTL